MVNRGRRPYVPIELINEINIVKNTDGCKSSAEAMRKIAKEYSPTGRELKKLSELDFIKNVWRKNHLFGKK